MNKPKISVIMAAYNAVDYIEKSIVSILEQTFDGWELIIINDCSTDRTPEIIERYTKLDPRISLLNNPVNINQALSRNRGISEARGKYIAILDDDDIAFPSRLKIQCDFLENNPSVALVASAAEIIDKNGKIIGHKRSPENLDELKFRIILKNPLVHSSVMYRKELMEKIGGYNNKYFNAEDYKFYSELIKQHEITSLPDVLLKYRHTPQAISIDSSSRKIQLEQSLEVNFENINNYISLSREKTALLINVLHKNDLRISSIISSSDIYKKIINSFIIKEGLNQARAEKIWRIYNSERRSVFRHYLKNKNERLVNFIEKIFFNKLWIKLKTKF